MIELDDTARVRKPRPFLERDIERRLCDAVKAAGGVAEKFTSPNRRSVPDRIVQFDGGHVCFVECKAPGKKPTAEQERDHFRRRIMGFRVYVVDSYDAVGKFIHDELTIQRSLTR